MEVLSFDWNKNACNVSRYSRRVDGTQVDFIAEDAVVDQPATRDEPAVTAEGAGAADGMIPVRGGESVARGVSPGYTNIPATMSPVGAKEHMLN